MLPSNGESNIQQNKFNKLFFSEQKKSYSDIINQHLYIISDDEIKENNTHFYNPHSGQLHISGNHTDYIAINKNGCKKIIATTDTSLLIDTYINQGDTVKGDLIIKRNSDYTTGLKGRINLHQPSQQFIQKYIEEYNKGNIIEDILVEYEYLLDDMGVVPYWNLKVNSKDNTITIRKVKENYTKEEVISLCDDAYKVGYGTAVCEETNQGKEVPFKEWLSTSVLDIEPNKIYTKDEVIRLLEKYTSFLWKEIGIHYPISLGKDAKNKFINSEL